MLCTYHSKDGSLRHQEAARAPEGSAEVWLEIERAVLGEMVGIKNSDDVRARDRSAAYVRCRVAHQGPYVKGVDVWVCGRKLLLHLVVLVPLRSAAGILVVAVGARGRPPALRAEATDENHRILEQEKVAALALDRITEGCEEGRLGGE